VKKRIQKRGLSGQERYADAYREINIRFPFKQAESRCTHSAEPAVSEFAKIEHPYSLIIDTSLTVVS
jgi:hypothetical protein